MGFKEAGKQILKANFGAAISELLIPSQYRNGQQIQRSGNIDFIEISSNASGAYFTFDGIGSALAAYEECPPLQAICNRRALALINGIPLVKNSLGKPSASVQGRRLLKLLANPNPMQTQSAFLSQISTYLDTVGYAVIVPLRPVGFEMVDSESLWVIPPTMVSFWNRGQEINFTTGGIDAVNIGGKLLDPNDVIIISDINPSTKKMVVPGSKIKALEKPINNIIGAMESEGTLIYHRGPTGIISPLYNKDIGMALPLTEPEKAEIQANFNRSYGLKNGQSHIIITTKATTYTQTGFDITELGLHDSIRVNTKTICDTIGYPPALLGILDSKYDVLAQADKQLYTKFIIPHAQNISEQLSSYMLSINETLTFDYSHVPELQADKQKEATARKTLGEALEREFKMNLVTYNRMLVLLGEETREGFDKYYSELKDEMEFLFGQNNNTVTQQTTEQDAQQQITETQDEN